MTQPIIFCPQCQKLLWDAPACTACSWQRPAPADEPGSLLWEKQITGRWQAPYHHLLAAPGLVIAHFDADPLTTSMHSRVVAYEPHQREVRWQYDFPPKKRGQPPIIVGNQLILTADDISMLPQLDSQASIVALNLADGQIAWQRPLPYAHSLSPPTLAHDLLFVSDNQQTGYGLEATTGELRWRVPRLPFWNRWQPAVASQTEIFLVNSPSPDIIALHVETGQVRSVYRPDNPAQFQAHHKRNQLAYANGRLFLITQDEQVSAIDASSGQRLWQLKSPRGVTAPPVATADTLYLAVKETHGNGYSLHALAATTGKKRWRFNASRHFQAAPLATAETIYVGNDERKVYALDAATGQPVWETEVNGRIRYPPVQQAHQLYVVTNRGYLLALVAQQKTPPARQTAVAYRQQEKWYEAGIEAALAGEHEQAAQDFIQADRLYQAAQLYEEAKNWEQAAHYYLLSDKPQAALQIGRQQQQPETMALSLLALGNYEDAANQYEKIGEYEQAAKAFEQAGLMTQAAICHAQAGNEPRAIEIYLLLDQPEAAVKLYQRLDQPEKAAHLWEKAGQLEKAAHIWQEIGQPEAAAALYGRHQQWTQAAAIWQEIGDLHQAAHLHEKGGQLNQAARLHVRLGQIKEAIRLYKRLKAMDKIAQLYEKEKSWAEAATAYLQMTPPHEAAAAHCYQQLGEWERAAELYEAAQEWEQAADCWQQAGQPLPAAKLFLTMGRTVAAADLFLKAGQPQQALQLLAESQAWIRLRQVANQLNEHQREADACLALAQRSQGSDAWMLYQAAAQAFMRAADQQEEATPQQPDKAAQLWEQAAHYMQEGFGDQQDIEHCQRQIRRLRRLPDLAVTVEASGDLIEGRYSILLVKIENVGHGPARHVSVRVQSSDFEGDTAHTQKLRGTGAIWPGRKDTLQLRVQPQPGVAGLAVPLDMELAYLMPDDSKFTRDIRGQVSVRPRESQSITPHPDRWTPLSMAGSAATVVYAEKAEFYSEGSQKVMGDAIQAGGQKGDKVEINRRDRQAGIELSSGGATQLPAPTTTGCEAGQHDIRPGGKFCARCGEAVKSHG